MRGKDHFSQIKTWILRVVTFFTVEKGRHTTVWKNIEQSALGCSCSKAIFNKLSYMRIPAKLLIKFDTNTAICGFQLPTNWFTFEQDFSGTHFTCSNYLFLASLNSFVMSFLEDSILLNTNAIYWIMKIVSCNIYIIKRHHLLTINSRSFLWYHLLWK